MKLAIVRKNKPGSVLCLLGFLILILFVNSCNNSSENSGKTIVDEEDLTCDFDTIRIVRLDTIIARFDQFESPYRENIFDQYYSLFRGYGQFVLGTDSITQKDITALANSDATLAFMPEVDKVFSALNTEEEALGKMLTLSKVNGLELNVENFVSATWPKYTSVVVIDTINTVYIALNHYLGSEHPAYQGWPEYRRVFKSRDRIPVDVTEALLNIHYPYTPEESQNNVLARILYEGAQAYARHILLPDEKKATVLGFTESQLEDIEVNSNVMWDRLISENLLYSTDPAVHASLFDLQPSSSLISPDAPGRAVRYLGYKFVEDYLKENPQTSLMELLSPSFYADPSSTLKESKQ